MQEYEQELSSLSSELATARDQAGGYLSSHKYQGLIDQVNRQKIAIDNEKVGDDDGNNNINDDKQQEAARELGSLLKKKSHELSESTRKFSDLKETLDCTWTIIQKTGGSSLLKHLEAECNLSARAHLLLAVSDEAAKDRRVKKEKEKVVESMPVESQRHSHGHGHTDRQHWLLG